MKPVCAASWWARTTSVRGAPGSPSRATRLTVVCSRRIARRRTRGPFWISSTKPASATAESVPPSTPASGKRQRRAGGAERAEARGVGREGAPARLVLERDLLYPRRPEPRGQPLRGLALAGRAWRPLDRGQALDHLAKRVLRRRRKPSAAVSSCASIGTRNPRRARARLRLAGDPGGRSVTPGRLRLDRLRRADLRVRLASHGRGSGTSSRSRPAGRCPRRP